jgi:hypothetical protein
MRRFSCEPSDMMNQRLWILALTTALALAAGCKKDQPAAPAPSDETANQPGVKPGPADPAQAGSGSNWRNRRRGGPMTDEERTAMFKRNAEALHKRLDTDGDGKLTPAELAAAGGGGRMRFDDPAAIDTNHDGDISSDELVAAMKARFEQRRAQRGGSGSADGSGGEDGSGGGEGSGGAGGAGGW